VSQERTEYKKESSNVHCYKNFTLLSEHRVDEDNNKINAHTKSKRERNRENKLKLA
jgi:hypothetical protein